MSYTLKQIKEARSEAYEQARQEAKFITADWRLIALDPDGERCGYDGEYWFNHFPTKLQIDTGIQKLLKTYSDVKEIWIDGTYRGSDNFQDHEEGLNEHLEIYAEVKIWEIPSCVQKLDRDPFVPGGRLSTAKATRKQLERALGEPTYDDPSEDEKVTHGWVFNTPRGLVELRDYWWNAEDEYSVAGPDHKAALWLNRYLRRKGIPAGKNCYHKL